MRCSFLPQDLYAASFGNSQVIFLGQNEPSRVLCHLCDPAIKKEETRQWKCMISAEASFGFGYSG